MFWTSSSNIYTTLQTMVMLLNNVNSSLSQNEPRNRTAFVKVLYQTSYLLCDMIKSTFVDRSNIIGVWALMSGLFKLFKT